MRNYEVGYCRPPKHSRFKKGECRNPRGRGKRERTEMTDVIHSVLSEEIEYREGHRTRRATKQELLIRKLFSAALRGDVTSAGALPVPWLSGSSMIPMKTPRISGSKESADMAEARLSLAHRPRFACGCFRLMG